MSGAICTVHNQVIRRRSPDEPLAKVNRPAPAASNELLYAPKAVEESQQAAEALAKTVIAGFGLCPATVHDLDALATQLENAYRGRARGAVERKRFAAAIRELDGNTRAAHLARYHATPVELPERTAARIGCAMRLQTMWLRWYAGRNPETRDVTTRRER